jgi:peptide-methionine (S)-S-oxide reductase
MTSILGAALMFLNKSKTAMPEPGQALPGRDMEMPVVSSHFVNGHSLKPPFAEGLEQAVFGLGCFWGAEKLFWELPGVYTTAVGYAGGETPNPTYEEVCSAGTGHNEVVLVVYDPKVVSYDDLLKAFWEDHNPTQGDRQGNDVGSQYRSAIYATDDTQLAAARASKEAFARSLSAAGFGSVTTEILPAGQFYYAEAYHQQYLHKVPNGYCPVNSTGVSCSIPGAAVS